MRKVRKTRFQQLHLIITLLAALAVTGICIYTRAGLYTMAVLVSATIVGFYVLGQVVRMYLASVLVSPPEETVVPEEGQDFIAGEVIEDDEGQFANAYAEFDEAES